MLSTYQYKECIWSSLRLNLSFKRAYSRSYISVITRTPWQSKDAFSAFSITRPRCKTVLNAPPLSRLYTTRLSRKLGAPKNVLTITPGAVDKLKAMQTSESKLIRIGIKSKGCAGNAYTFEYIKEPTALDEIVEQDGVKVVVDSRALLQIIGSTMDYVDDELQSRFVFQNPNVKSQCGCGESIAF